MTQDRNIQYINREFGDFREQLIELSKNYFRDTYNDFSPTSPGMMFMEMVAYVGDVLSFYQDMQLQETVLQYAKEPGNLYNIAYMMGYRPKMTSVSKTVLEISQIVPATGSEFTPDYNYALSIPAGAVIKASVGKELVFLIDTPVDFSVSSSYDPTEVYIETLQEGIPYEYRLVKQVKASSKGNIKTITKTFGTAEKFSTLLIEDSDIIEVLDVVEVGNPDNRWYEVPFLGQETIFEDIVNIGNEIPYSLSLRKVPRRFTTRFTSEGYLQIQFGAGVVDGEDSTFTPDPTNVGLGTSEGIHRLDHTYDPSNFLYTQAYGLAPSNITLSISYSKGGGILSNAPAGTITQFLGLSKGGSIVDSSGGITYLNTLTFINPLPATGGKDGDTIEEIRQNAMRSFAEQGRAVTLQDYQVRAMSLPAKYGAISKVYITQDQLTNTNSTTDSIIDSNPLALSMYVLSYDNNKNLKAASDTLKQNLKTYLSQYMLLTDAINIRDAFVVNIGVNFDIIVKPSYNGKDVLANCINILKDHFNITKWSINEPINTSTVTVLLSSIQGVQTVQKVEVINKQGGNYSDYAYDIIGATRSGIVYPSYDMMIFEVKYPDIDIKGRTTVI